MPTDAKELTLRLKHEELTGKIISIFYAVYNELGHGFIEGVYEAAMKIALEEAGFQIRQQVPITVWFRGQQIGDFRADLLVNDTAREAQGLPSLFLALRKDFREILDLAGRMSANIPQADGIDLPAKGDFPHETAFRSHSLCRPQIGRTLLLPGPSRGAARHTPAQRLAGRAGGRYRPL